MDWLAGGDRTTLAIEKICAAAADAVAARGLDRLSIEDVADRAGCSRATVYRHVGGKRQLRDAVLGRSIARIGVAVAESVANLDGRERVVRAILSALDIVRSDGVASALFADAPKADNLNRTLIDSPRLAAAAAELTGLSADDTIAPDWIVRVVLALLYWPMRDREAEEAVVRRFVAAAAS